MQTLSQSWREVSLNGCPIYSYTPTNSAAHRLGRRDLDLDLQRRCTGHGTCASGWLVVFVCF